MANRYSVETIFKAIDKISAPVSRMQKRVKDFTESASKGLKKAADTTWAWTKGLTAAGGIAAGAFVTAAGGIALFVTETNKANAEMANMSKAMGISVDMTRAMDGVLANSTMNWENFTDQIEEMRNKFGEMKGAGEMKKLSEALKVAGLKWKDLKNLSPEKQYIKIMDALVKMTDAQKAAFVADEIFGGEGNKITGLLRARGQTMTEVMEAYQKYNFYTKEGQKASEDFNKAIAPLSQIAQSVKSQLAGMIGAALIPLVKNTTDWAAANKDLIQSKIAEYAQKIADSFTWLIQNFDKVMYYVKMFAWAIGIFLALTLALKTFVLVMTAVNLVMAANPVVLITLAIIALIAVVAYVIDRFIGWGNALKIVGAAILLAMGPIGWIIGAAVLIYKNWETVSGFFKNLWTSVVDSFKFAKDWISTYIDGIVTKVQGLINLASGLTGKVSGWFGGGGSAEAAGASVSSPQQRTANQISEKRNVSEVTIFDKTGQAKQTKGKPGNGVRLAHSGGFN